MGRNEEELTTEVPQHCPASLEKSVMAGYKPCVSLTSTYRVQRFGPRLAQLAGAESARLKTGWSSGSPSCGRENRRRGGRRTSVELRGREAACFNRGHQDQATSDGLTTWDRRFDPSPKPVIDQRGKLDRWEQLHRGYYREVGFSTLFFFESIRFLFHTEHTPSTQPLSFGRACGRKRPGYAR